MSFTFKSSLGKLKLGSTPTLTLLDTTSSLNFASLKITNSLNLDYAGAGILHIRIRLKIYRVHYRIIQYYLYHV